MGTGCGHERPATGWGDTRTVKGWAAWLLAVGLSLTATAQAALRLELQEDGLTEAERSVSQQFLQEALDRLPPRFISEIDQTLSVRWRDGMPPEVYGRASQTSAQIELNASLLPLLVDGSAATDRTGRPHQTQRQELLATLLHELTHVYDRARLWSADERSLQQNCRRIVRQQGLAALPEGCIGQTDRRFTLSDDPALLDLAGWPQKSGGRGERETENYQQARSPDRYELTNAREFVAVNMEYFLLDPQYACRRPSLARYFSTHFSFEPFPQVTCSQQYPYLNAGSDFSQEPLARLDPERVYSVEYLLADANQEWASRWGHSMLRLVICAPGRPLGQDCRLDLDQHLVLSYRAFVGDVQLSSWSGLMGDYPSRLFVLPLDQVIEEYTKVELRGLLSVPLKLTREQISDLVIRAFEQHWNYDGRYYFISNNCAVETLKLLRSGSGDQRLQSLDNILPNGVLAILNSRGLADMSVLDDPQYALKWGYRFDSYRDRYQTMFEVLRKSLPITQTQVEDWLNLPAEQRRVWFAQASLRASAALLILEQAALRRHLLLVQDELKQRYMSKDASDAQVEKAGRVLQQVMEGSGFLSQPAQLLDQGYGLPLAEDWQHLQAQSQARQQELKQMSETLDEQIRQLVSPERMAELKATEENVTVINQHLRELHRASGGVTL